MKAVIVNADDFGLSAGVDKGILAAYQRGIVTSTSILANLDGFAHAAAMARAHPDLPAGVHLNLFWGRPVAKPSEVPGLVDARGDFRVTPSGLFRAQLAGRLPRGELVTEFVSQIRRVIDAGIRPTHVDTHRHCHCLAGVLEAVLEAAESFGIRRIRLPVERHAPGVRLPWSARRDRALLGWLSRGHRARLARAGFRAPDDFAASPFTHHPREDVLARMLLQTGDGVTEVACHPGHVDQTVLEFSRIPPHRGAELAALISPRVRDLVRNHDLRLISFRDL